MSFVFPFFLLAPHAQRLALQDGLCQAGWSGDMSFVFPFFLLAPHAQHLALQDGLCQAGWSGDMSVLLQLPSLHCSQVFTATSNGILGPAADLDVEAYMETGIEIPGGGGGEGYT